MADQSIVDFIDNVLKEEDEHGPTVCLIDVSSSTLQNYRIGRDPCQRDAYITADIHPQDLNETNGANPTGHADKWARESGYACNEPGLIIPKEFGGSGGLNNVFPQSKFYLYIVQYNVLFQMDTTALANDKTEARDHLLMDRPDRYAQLIFAFEYTEGAVKFYRPMHIYYRFLLYENKTVVKELTNKLMNMVRY